MTSENRQVSEAKKWRATLALLGIALAAVGLLSVNVGYVRIPPETILAALLKQIPVVGRILFPATTDVQEEIILLQIRLPRIITAILVGAALAGSGVTFQAVFRNPLADPYVLGISAGAAAGAAAAIVAGTARSLIGAGTIQLAAFVGALATSFLVYRIAQVGGRAPLTTLLLAGISASVFLSAIVTLLIVLSNPYTGELQALIFWLLGSLANASWNEIGLATPTIIFGLALMIGLGRQLNLMLLGDEAQLLGVDVERMRRILVGIASLLTSATVALSGIIGFVGLIIPHMVRLIVGPDHRILLPASTLVGASLLIVFDTVARVIYSPAEFPVGVITALAGGPFFLFLLKQKKGEYAL